MKKPPVLLHQLVVMSRIGQLYIGMFLLSSSLVFSFATSLVEKGQGNIAFVIGPGVPRIHVSKEGADYTPFQSLTVMGLHSLWFADLTPVLSFEGFGNISLGPLRFSSRERYRLNLKNMGGEAVQMDSLNGMVSFLRPANPGEILDAIRFPFLVSVFCFGLINLTILEVLARMLKMVAKGDAFTLSSVRGAQIIGALFVASGILQPLATGWAKSTIAAYAMNHLATSTYFDTRFILNYPVIFTGVVVLALAELFRQGLIIKDENTLTI